MAQLLTARRQQYAKRVVYDILFSAGYGVKPIKNKFSGQDIPGYLDACGYDYECGRIAAELATRGYSNTDPSISTIYQRGRILIETDSAYRTAYCNGKSVPNVSKKDIARMFSDVEEFALGIALVAKQMGLFWDDTALAVHEKQQFENTYLGAAVAKAEVYLSQQGTNNANAPKPQAKTGVTRTTTPRQAGAAPANNYKSTGPQSGNVRDLKGTPGQKEKLTGTVFKVEGVNAKSAKNKAKLFIKPLDTSAPGGTNKVMMGSANGYTDCVCHFDNANDADSFLRQWAQDNPTQTQFTNVQVVRKTADSNGYYRVGTNYGDCYISAGKLNEDIFEQVEQEEDLQERKKRIDELAAEGYQANNPELFDECFNKYE